MRRLVPLLMLALLASGCRPLSGGGASGAPAQLQPGQYDGMHRDALGPHRARFELRFVGQDDWTYFLEHRLSSEALEHRLQIEGVSDARDPGDVRMVTRAGETRLRGPGTSNQCLRFPADMDVNITVLTPDDVMPPAQFREPLVHLADEQVAGRQSVHYALVQAELDGWEEVRLGLWLEPGSGALLRYELSASGFDPYFGAGFGQLEGRFEVLEFGPQLIEPIEGCEIDLPLPSELDGLVRLENVVAFQTNLSLDDTVAFFRRQLEQAGWQPLTEEQRSSGAIVLNYRQGAEQLELTIRSGADATRVEIVSKP